jgi:hypothetical protein
VPGATFANTSVGINPDLSFSLGGLTERQTFRLGSLPDGWFLKSVTHEGRDITDAGHDFKPGERVSGIQIQLTRRATTLTGAVLGDRGEPIADYTVVAFAADRAKWGYLTRFVRSARPDQNAALLPAGRRREWSAHENDSSPPLPSLGPLLPY